MTDNIYALSIIMYDEFQANILGGNYGKWLPHTIDIILNNDLRTQKSTQSHTLYYDKFPGYIEIYHWKQIGKKIEVIIEIMMLNLNS